MVNEFYDFSDKPFELLPDPKFLFLTTSHRSIIASVMEGIKNQRGFISIIGEAGTGKTILIHHILGKLESEENVKTILIFHPTITFKELLNNILLKLGLEAIKESKGTLLRKFNDYLTQMRVEEKTLVMIIDEAQDLAKEVMGELGMLPKTSAFQIIFVGQPEFEEKLNSQGLMQLKQRIGIKHQIKGFSEEESKDYIDHRLRLVRSSSSERFTPKAISMICSHAKGTPRIINILCDNAFRKGSGLSQKKIDVDIIHEVIKEMEGPSLRKGFFSPIVSKIKDFRLSPLRSNFLLSIVSLIVLSLLCLGGFVFLIHRYVQPKPNGPYVDTKPSSIFPLPQKIAGEISGSNTDQPPAESKSISPKSSKSASSPNAPPVPMEGEDRLMIIVTVKEGYSLSYLTEIYYGMFNRSLVDFILDFNPEINNAHLILVDQNIKIPKITSEILTARSDDHGYTIRAGTFRSPDFISYYLNEPVLKGMEVKVSPRKISPHETWYRVMIGPLDNKEDCLRVINRLKEKGLLPAFGGIFRME